MKLIEALEIARRPVPESAAKVRAFLACGFTPLHLQTFIAGHLRAQKEEPLIELSSGLFGDLCGSIERLDSSIFDLLVVVVEWNDIDPRLGFRALGGWRPSDMLGILESARLAVARLERALTKIAGQIPATVVCMPTLPLPPMFATRPLQAGFFEAELHRAVAALAASVSRLPGLRMLSGQQLAKTSPPSERYDVRSDLTTGFPYTLGHACALGELLAELTWNRPPMKGLITDLDDTLWAGIVGEDGVEGISWHLDRNTQMHGVYQQLVASLAGAGVLVAVASKNDESVVARAFERKDLLLSDSEVFPFEANWSRKSESVRRILETWNVGANSVVFVDDSPMEVAEVKAAFPGMGCLVFPKGDYQGMLALFEHLRELFGKALLTEDDKLRLESIRSASSWRRDWIGSGGSFSEDEVLRAAEGFLFFSLGPEGVGRSFELVNKTNQFNLNGKRFTEAEWRRIAIDPSAFMLSVSYKDKYGPLGTIAVMLGKTKGHTVYVHSWVMSCRAFSRRIEFHCLQYIFERFAATEIVFDLQATGRNGVLIDFLLPLVEEPSEPKPRLGRASYLSKAPELPHHIEEVSVCEQR
jgi:FkbH-like protein